MPDKFNPFRPDKICPPGIFQGRIEELRLIDHCLMQTRGQNPQHFLIEGERGIGKSSIFLCERLVAIGKLEALGGGGNLNFIVVNISLEECDTRGSILKKLMGELRRQLNERSGWKSFALSALDFISRFEAGGVSYNRDVPQLDEAELFTQVQADFVKLLSNLDADTDGVLLLIDEADKAPPSAGLGKMCKLLTEELANKGCERLCIGVAGLPNVINVLRESHESSPRVFRTMSLQPLEDFETKRVIGAGIKEACEKNGFEVKITDDAADLIVSLSEGYPHFLQEFAYCAFEEDSDNVIDKADVSNSLFREHGAFDQLGRKFFLQYYVAVGSDDYRKVLDTMAKHLDEWVSRAAIIQESGLKGSTVDNALRALKGKNVILQQEGKAGHYKVPTKSFAVWINARTRAEQAISAEQEPNLFESD